MMRLARVRERGLLDGTVVEAERTVCTLPLTAARADCLNEASPRGALPSAQPTLPRRNAIRVGVVKTLRSKQPVEYDWSHGIGLLLVLNVRPHHHRGLVFGFGRTGGPHASIETLDTGRVAFRLLDKKNRAQQISISPEVLPQGLFFLAAVLTRENDERWSAGIWVNGRLRAARSFRGTFGANSADNERRLATAPRDQPFPLHVRELAIVTKASQEQLSKTLELFRQQYGSELDERIPPPQPPGRRWLFVETVRDLEQRANSNSVYDVLRSSGLIRQLLFDHGTPLVEVVNQEERLKVQFRVRDFKPMPIPGLKMQLMLDLADPTMLPTHPDWREVPLSTFLAHPVGFAAGKTLTVRDFVAYAAYQLGGVHTQGANTPEEQALAWLGRFVNVGGDPALRTLKSIARACALGLEPLRRAIESAHVPGENDGRTG